MRLSREEDCHVESHRYLEHSRALYSRIRERAERKNRTIEAEALAILAAGLGMPEAAPSADAAFPAIGTEAWREINRRRIALIYKKHLEGLSEGEQSEYERLQTLVGEALDAAFPRPLDDEERLDQLEERARQRARNSST